MGNRIIAVLVGLVLAIAIVPMAVADSDRSVGLNLLFNGDGFQGVNVFASKDDVEVHVGHTEQNDWIVGAGYRVADTEDRGLAGDDIVSASVTVGGAYVGGSNSGLRPFGQVNGEIDVTDNGDEGLNVNVGAISYGLGLNKTPGLTDNYGYVGGSIEHLVDNRSVNVGSSSAGGGGSEGGSEGGSGEPGDDETSDGDEEYTEQQLNNVYVKEDDNGEGNDFKYHEDGHPSGFEEYEGNGSDFPDDKSDWAGNPPWL